MKHGHGGQPRGRSSPKLPRAGPPCATAIPPAAATESAVVVADGQPPVDPLLVRAEGLLRSSGWEIEHVRQVTRLSLQLFDLLAAQLGIELAGRRLLQAAGLVHDSCFPVDPERHHKAARDAAIAALSPVVGPETARIIGNVARYHRRAPPTPAHGSFARLTPMSQRLVEQLASLLRIADGLDRPHGQRVVTLRGDVANGLLTITVVGHGDLSEELQGAERKRDLLVRTFGMQVRLVAEEEVG